MRNLVVSLNAAIVLLVVTIPFKSTLPCIKESRLIVYFEELMWPSKVLSGSVFLIMNVECPRLWINLC